MYKRATTNNNSTMKVACLSPSGLTLKRKKSFMLKKFLQTMGLITLLLNHSTNSEPYDDFNGRSAPIAVLKQVRSLETSYENVQTRHPHPVGLEPCFRVWCCICCCCGHCATVYNWQDMKPIVAQSGRHDGYSFRTENALFEDLHDMVATETVLRKLLNECVVQPVQQVDDIPSLLKWVRRASGSYYLATPLETSVLEWVNNQGGWKRESGTRLLLNGVNEKTSLLNAERK